MTKTETLAEAVKNQGENQGSTIAEAVALTRSDPKAVVAVRKNTHGDWKEQSRTSYEIKNALRRAFNWKNLSPSQREALDMIAVKMSRITTGNSREPDHWLDIQGYAELGMKGHE